MADASQNPIAVHGMVTGTTGAAAIEAGVDILKQGGSAADAAMATAMTQVCMAAGSWVSYAGIMTMVYFDAATGKVYDMNAGFNTVQGETDPQSMPGFEFADVSSKGFTAATYTPSGRTTLVPGFMAGVEAAHERFGKLPFARIFEPAIRCAEQGVEWNTGLARQFAFREKVLTRLPETKDVFVKPDGSNYRPGDTFKQPVLAATLRTVAEKGVRRYLYTGDWAKKLVAAVQRDGGKMTLKDLANYRVIWSEPAHGAYHGYDIYAHGPPADGGVNLIEAMNLAEVAGLSSLGHYSESPQALFWLAQIAKPAVTLGLGGKTTSEELGTALGLDLSLTSRLKKATSAKLWEAIKTGRFPGAKAMLQKRVPVHSDAIVAVDKAGNIAAVVHSINTVSWGATGIFVDGISIPDSASFQRVAMARIAPGSRLPDPTNPGLVVKEGKPFMGFSSIGSGLHIRTVASLMSVLDFGMTPQQAIDKPSLGMFKFDPATRAITALTVGAKQFEPAFLDEVADFGEKVVEDDALRGYWIGVQLDPETGRLYGGAIRGLELGGRAVGY